MPQGQSSEYRVRAIDAAGKPVQGIVNAENLSEARKKAKTLASTRKVRVLSVIPKRTFIYKAKKGDKVIVGEQTAFLREDVTWALQKIGYTVVSVRRKWFDIGSYLGVPVNEIVSFLGVSAKLLEEKMPFNEVLQLLTSTVKHPGLKNALKDITKELSEGADSRSAFVKQEHVFGKNIALMLGIASKSGDITSIFRSIAKFVEREAEFKKSLRSALILPSVTMLALVGALLFYVVYILPQMTKVFTLAKAKLPALTQSTLAVSEVLQDNILLIVVLVSIVPVGFYQFVRSPRGKELYDRWIIRIPYFGRVLHNTSIELFCRVLGIVYTSGGENISAINVAAEACRNKHIEKQIRAVAIPQMLQYGIELSVAMEATGVFPDMALSRFRAGAETGGVKSAAVQLADFYEMENRFALKNMVDFIQLMISLIIMVAMIFLTVLSSETANVSVNRY